MKIKTADIAFSIRSCAPVVQIGAATRRYLAVYIFRSTFHAATNC